MAKILKPKNLICHICYEKNMKTKLFKNTKNLNIHLKMKHNVKYKILIVGGSTMAILNTKTPRFAAQSL